MSVAATCLGCQLSCRPSPHITPRRLRYPEGSNLVQVGVRRCRVLSRRSMSRSGTTRRFSGSGSIFAGAEVEEADISRTGLVGTSRSLPLGNLDTTLNRLSKWLVCAIFGMVILYRRDAEAMWAAMGSVINVQLSVTLKQIINHERPVPGLKPDPGMPSSHAQAIFYAALFLVLSMIHWSGVNLFTVLAGALIIGSSAYFSWLRVTQRFHTTAQVLVGAILGSLCGTLWFWSWHTFVWQAFVASIWVRMLVVLGSVSICAGFVIYAIKHWSQED